MKIGDWEIKITRLDEFRTVPGDPESELQRMFFFIFHYIPTDFTIPRTIHFIKFKSDDDVREFLKDYVKEMKQIFIDPHPVPDINFFELEDSDRQKEM